jgi:3-hydroxyacyl-CoA dehydrogenase, NAD binding domain
MGAGIAQVAALDGDPVQLFDAVPGAAEQAVARLRERVASLAAKGKIEASTADLQVIPVGSLAELALAEIVIEAVVEDLAAGQELFAQLESLIGEDMIGNVAYHRKSRSRRGRDVAVSSGGGPRGPSVGRLHGQPAGADAGVTDHDERACGEILGDLFEVRENDRSKGSDSLVGAPEQDDAQR